MLIGGGFKVPILICFDVEIGNRINNNQEFNKICNKT